MTLVTERVGRICVITLDRPEKRNALTRETSTQILDAFEAFDADEELWVAVIAGNGPDFCAGMDLGRAREGGRRRVPEAGITRRFECWKPIVAALHGNVLGGGLELALCADIRVADTTLRIGAPEVKWGRMQGAGATQRLTRAIPMAVAVEMLMTGDPIDATRAERVGLVNQVVPEGRALSAAMEMAERLLRSAPVAVRRAKEAAYRGVDLTIADGLRLEQVLSRTLAGTDDLREGTRAFLERRRAEWTAR